MRKLTLALSVLSAAALIVAASPVAAQDGPTSGEITGEVLKINREGAGLTIRDSEGEAVAMRVDERAVPGWYRDLEIGDRVRVRWEFKGEQGRQIVGITKLKR